MKQRYSGSIIEVLRSQILLVKARLHCERRSFWAVCCKILITAFGLVINVVPCWIQLKLKDTNQIKRLYCFEIESLRLTQQTL